MQDAPDTTPQLPLEPATDSAPVGRVRVRSLTVHQFRDVRPGTTLRFGEGTHLVLGKNASGKSTLLELLAAVAALNFRSAFFQATPFHIEAELSVGDCTLQVEVRRQFERMQMRSVGDKYLDLPPRDEAELVASLDVPGVLTQWVRARTGGDAQTFRADPRIDESAPTGMRWLGGTDPLAMSLAWVLGQCATVEMGGVYRLHPMVWDRWLRLITRPGTGAPYDEALGALDSIVKGDLAILRGKSTKAGSQWLPPSLDFEASGEPITLELSADPTLRDAIRRLGYEEAKLHFGPGTAWGTGWRYTSPSIQLFRGGRAVRRHDQLSYGEQRLLSFAWYLACNPDVAVADELVNGLHAEWLDWSIDALGDRQSFLSAQSPLLVDSVPFASEAQLRQGIILCEAIPRADGGGDDLVWRQLDARESDLLARAFAQSRLDLLSDLLHALGLW